MARFKRPFRPARLPRVGDLFLLCVHDGEDCGALIVGNDGGESIVTFLDGGCDGLGELSRSPEALERIWWHFHGIVPPGGIQHDLMATRAEFVSTDGLSTRVHLDLCAAWMVELPDGSPSPPEFFVSERDHA